MKILYTLDSGQPGGMEYHTLDLVNGMIQHGHKVIVLCNKGPLAEMFKKTGATVYTTSLIFDIDPLYFFKIINLIKQEKVDVLHAHELRAVINSIIAGKLAGVKVLVTHIHTPLSHWPLSSKKRGLYTAFYSKIINVAATCEVALTPTIKKVKLLEGIRSDKIVVIPNGFKAKKFDVSAYDKEANKKEMSQKYGFPLNRFIFGNTSRLSANKGTDQILSAYKMLLDNKQLDSKQTHLLLAGKGEMLGQAKKLCKSLGLDEFVTFTGTFPDEDHVKLYNSIDGFVFATESEGFGLVLVEAMALNIPIICSDIEVLRDVGARYVFEYFSNNPKSIAASMLKLYKDYDNALKLSDNARNFVLKTYSMEKFITNYEELYKNLLKDVR